MLDFVGKWWCMLANGEKLFSHNHNLVDVGVCWSLLENVCW